ncbi:hypothetical protein, partial [Escherichia coli]|uniref:hypothetical protein n=1 Tax=Escherichia coli TaxID=562 RepID=UPI001BE3D056
MSFGGVGGRARHRNGNGEEGKLGVAVHGASPDMRAEVRNGEATQADLGGTETMRNSQGQAGSPA